MFTLMEIVFKDLLEKVKLSLDLNVGLKI